jgi:hypothetical protein
MKSRLNGDEDLFMGNLRLQNWRFLRNMLFKALKMF